MTDAPARRTALVTGATGFVGGRLVDALVAGGWKVHAVVRSTSDAAVAAQLSAGGCKVHVHDGTLASVADIVGECEPDCTWHLATRFIGDHAPGDVTPLVRDNVEFGAVLLEALGTMRQPALVTVGTLWQQHGNAAYSPMSLYAATKEAFDALVAYYADVRRFRVVECLLTDTYGAGDRRRKLLWQLFNAARTDTPLAMSGTGSQYIDLLHVDDAVRALVVAGERAAQAPAGTNERWAVRTGNALTVRELVSRVGATLGTEVPVHWGARPSRPREMTTPWTAGEPLPGWAATVALEDGLREFR